MNIDLTFAQNYTLNTYAWLPPCPSSTPLYYYPGANKVGGQDGALLEIAPDDGITWMGMFAGGHRSYLSGVYGCPNGHSICVVSLGRCYFVQAGDPYQWREKTETVSNTKVLPDHNMLILCNEKSLTAYGAHGFLWETEAISNNGLTIEDIDGNILHGKAPLYYRRDGVWIDYEVNLVSGKHRGGTGRK